MNPGGALRWAVAAIVALAAAAAPAAAQPTPAPPQVIDGPNAAIARPAGLGLSIARDGTGGLVYLKGGHVFVSRLVGGRFQPPGQVDSALGGASSQPVIAAGNGGILLVGFINGGALYVVDRGGTLAPYSGPIGLSPGATNPAISMSNFGKAYLAFTAAGGGGHDVRTAYYVNGRWALESPSLNAVPDDDAGTGSGPPRVATAGDGVAIVVWGEGGHVISRRVWGTLPSVVHEQADPPLGGCSELSADQPAVSSGGDSSYADVAFRERLSCGAGSQSRVLVNRLHGSLYDGIAQPDGLTSPGVEGAAQPQVVMGEFGHGFVTSARTTTNDAYAMALGDNGRYGGVFRVNGLPSASPPFAVPAIAGLTSDLIAWQRAPGGVTPPEIRVRYSANGAPLSPDMVVSSPAQGPADAASGLVAGGDAAGDAGIAWVQGAPGATEIVTAQLYEPPGSFHPLQAFRYVRSAHPTLAWSSARASWGTRYLITVDGRQVGQTDGTALRVPARLADGPHVWQAMAANAAGLTSTARPARVFVDTVAPHVRLSVSGARRAGSVIDALVRYRDLPPAGRPSRSASGVVKVVLRWGDGTVVRMRLGTHGERHSYRGPGRYRVTVLVTDRAGNTRKLVIRIRIAGQAGSARPGKRSH